MKMFRFMTAVIAAAAIPLCAGCGQSAPSMLRADASAVEALRSKLMVGVQSSGEAGPAAQATGWAKLSGTFKLVGDPPPPAQLPITKEQDICAPAGKPVYSHALMVDPKTKGIANIAIYPKKVGSVNDSAKTPPAAVPTFDQKQCLFATPLLGVQVGQKFLVKNSDSTTHNFHTAPVNNAAENKNISAGKAEEQAFTKEEPRPVPVNCDVHPWMKAYILPRANAYFAVTKDDGSFEIADLPAGEDLEIVVWHELAPNIPVNATAQKISGQGRFKIKLEPGKDVHLDIEVPVATFVK